MKTLEELLHQVQQAFQNFTIVQETGTTAIAGYGILIIH